MRASVAGLSRARIRRKLLAVLSGIELEAEHLVLSFAPRGKGPLRIEDIVPLSAPGEMSTVYGVGRLIRLMRAARVPVPRDPYALAHDRERALELLRRCLGVEVQLHVDRRLQRVLTFWTESGVQTVGGLVDLIETPDRLSIRRRGGRSLLHVPKRDLIRFETSTEDEFIVVSIEAERSTQPNAASELAHPEPF